MKILITDVNGNTQEFRTNCDCIQDVIDKINDADEYVTFKFYSSMSNYEYDRAINKNHIVTIEEINDSRAFTKNPENRRYTF